MRSAAPTVPEPILVDVPTAARLLSISERTLRSAEWSDAPKFVKGGRVLYSPAALRKWVRDQITKPAAGEAGGADA